MNHFFFQTFNFFSNQLTSNDLTLVLTNNGLTDYNSFDANNANFKIWKAATHALGQESPCFVPIVCP